MRRLILCAASWLASVAILTAQDPANLQKQGGDRLGSDLRTAQYGDATRLIDDLLRRGGGDDLRNLRAMFGDAPNMRVRRGSTRFGCEVHADGVLLPLTVNGSRVTWLMDTGINFTAISDAEARRLGMEIQRSDGQVRDFAGGQTGVRRAVARRMVIGNTELRDVMVAVLPADQMPWKELPPGRQGILGLPVALAFDAMRWSRAGVCYTGAAALDHSTVGPANLAFYQLDVIVTVQYEGKPLEFILDTGNQSGTQFWERFGSEFSTVVRERGTKGSVRVTQVGGANDRETTAIPDLQLTVGGKTIVLPRANVFSKPVGDSRFHGLLGMDVLSQADDVTIDFRSMRLALR